MKSISHPYLMSAISVYVDEEETVILMKKAQFGDLGKRQVLTRAECLEVFFKLLCGLNFLHKNNIIHGDIKGVNILAIKDKTDVRLSDFSLSRIYTKRPFRRLSYTLTHRAPEILHNKSWDFPAEIFALGCTFYEIAFGKILFLQNEHKEIFYKEAYYDFCNRFYFDDSKQSDRNIIFKPVIPVDTTCDIWKEIIIKMLHPVVSKRATIDQLLELPIFENYRHFFRHGSILRKTSPCIGSVIDCGEEYSKTCDNLERLSRAVILTYPELRVDACLLICYKIFYFTYSSITMSAELLQTEKEICVGLGFILLPDSFL